MQRVTLFDHIARTDLREAYHGEPHFEFLNRVHQPYWQQVRDVLEEWFSHVPDNDRADLLQRFRSSDNRQHTAAFWELYLHEAFTRMGFEVQVHPPAPERDTHPDFLVRGGEDLAFYVEAVSGSESDEDMAVQRRLMDLYRTINRRLQTPNFMLWVDELAVGVDPAPGREIVAWLSRWLASLDPDAIAVGLDVEGAGLLADHFPIEHWVRDGWRLRFRAIPLKPEARDASKHWALGAFGPGEASAIDTVTPLRSSLEKKAGKYGDLGAPFVIAVHRSDSFATEEFSVVSALFGSEAVQFNTITGESKLIRNPDGFWTRPPGPRATHVSAVITVLNLNPWTIAKVNPHVWVNPWADRELDASVPWTRTWADPPTGRLTTADATIPMHETLGLDADWPGVASFVGLD